MFDPAEISSGRANKFLVHRIQKRRLHRVSSESGRCAAPTAAGAWGDPPPGPKGGAELGGREMGSRVGEGLGSTLVEGRCWGPRFGGPCAGGCPLGRPGWALGLSPRTLVATATTLGRFQTHWSPDRFPCGAGALGRAVPLAPGAAPEDRRHVEPSVASPRAKPRWGSPRPRPRAGEASMGAVFVQIVPIRRQDFWTLRGARRAFV